MTTTLVPAVPSALPAAPVPGARPARATARPAVPASVPASVPDNRAPYVAWGLAWLVGYGSFAVSRGDDPLVTLPALVPVVLLVAGLLVAAAVTAVSIVRSQRGASPAEAAAGTLSGVAWGVGFTALFLLIAALAQVLGDPQVERLLWPAGSAVVVGLMYLLGGTAQRDVLQYVLGGVLALAGAASVFLGYPGHYAVLAAGGGLAYGVAAALEGPRRLAAAGRVVPAA